MHICIHKVCVKTIYITVWIIINKLTIYKSVKTRNRYMYLYICKYIYNWNYIKPIYENTVQNNCIDYLYII